MKLSRFILDAFLILVILPMFLISLANAGVARPMNEPGLLPVEQPSSVPFDGVGSVDIPASVFLPNRNTPSEFMSTGTIFWYRGEYGVDTSTPQEYTVAIEATVDHNGQYFFVYYETVGFIGINAFPEQIIGRRIVSVEIWFGVEASNLFPQEQIALTPVDFGIPLSVGMKHSDMVDLYYDIGTTDNEYAAYNFPPGVWYSIDLGTSGVEDFTTGRDNGMFAVGFTAKGWSLPDLYGVVGTFRIAGGGRVGFEPFFRIYYSTAVNTDTASFGNLKSSYSDN